MAEKSWLDQLKAMVSERLDIGTFLKEAGQMLDHKITQGAAELAHGLLSNADGHGGSAYLPYGMNNKPVEIEGPSGTYQDMLRDASQAPAPEQDRPHGPDR
jgi:hypothetical protein